MACVYALGVDLGATACSASIFRSGHAEVATLGSLTSWPALIALTAEGQVVAGERAEVVARSNPERTVSGAHRRIGDDTPLLFAGHSMSAEQLVGHQLRAVVDAVTSHEGEPPTRVAIARPADWGPYRCERFDDAVAFSAVPNVEILPAPVAAVEHHASLNEIADGARLGVFDMGGSSIVASIVEWHSSGHHEVGATTRVDDVGGDVLDDQLFAFAQRSLPVGVDVDPAALFASCIRAKVELSTSTEAVIEVGSVSLRVTRAEFEHAIRPHLERSVDALLETAEARSPQSSTLDGVLLVGGSSSVPLLGQLVALQLGVMVHVDVEPQHCAALGLARTAARTAGLVDVVRDASSTGTAIAAPPGARPLAIDAPAAPALDIGP